MERRQLRVWLIDDESFEHLLARKALLQLAPPAEPRIFDSAVAAMSALESADRNELPDLILCDLKMPQTDGFAFLKWLRASRWKAIPLILRSNSNLEEDVIRAYELGANAYHVKAGTFEQLQARLDRAVQYWGAECELPHVRVLDSRPATASVFTSSSGKSESPAPSHSSPI